MTKTYKDLIVWQQAMDIIEDVYVMTKNFPKDELYGLTSQIRRASVSIAANIAEGTGRSTKKEYCHFLAMSNGSLLELETHLLISERLKYISKEISTEMQAKIQSVGYLLHKLRQSLTP